ncbi:MAG: hypothetical protein ACI835_004278 [Planctomycetota bacterium]|jgi:hypothetical protein
MSLPDLSLPASPTLSDERHRSYLERGLLGLLHWLPLIAALALLTQIGILGLRPGLEERDYLEYHRAEVEARNAGLHERYRGISREVDAWGDPVYLERVRRWRAQQAEE